MPLIAFEGVGLVRGGRLLFEQVDFAVGAGQALRVCGPNGVGKSSLIRVAAGLLSPTIGRVRRDAQIALVDERLAFDGDRRLVDALRFWLALESAVTPAQAALDAFGLGPLAEIPVRMLSTGQRRRAALAAAWGGRARVWLLDEPLNGLDAAARVQALAAIRQGQAQGCAILYASHEPLDLADERQWDLGR